MIQTTEQYQFLYSTLAQYSSQLQHNQVLVLIEMMFRLDYRRVDEEMFKCHQIKGTVHPQKIINQILILKCQRNVNSKTDDVTTGGLDLQHHTDVCLHLKIKAVFINHDPSSA